MNNSAGLSSLQNVLKVEILFSGYYANPFFIVSARNRKNVDTKIAELKKMKVPFLVVCGEKVDHPNVVYRENAGKWDAINYAMDFLPEDANIVVLNDVDTEIHGFENAISDLDTEADLIYCKVQVPRGPQVKFYKLLNPLRRRFHFAASGELMVMNKEVFKEVLPLPPILAEDSYILFKTFELGYQANFCSKAYVTTERHTIRKNVTENRTRKPGRLDSGTAGHCMTWACNQDAIDAFDSAIRSTSGASKHSTTRDWHSKKWIVSKVRSMSLRSCSRSTRKTGRPSTIKVWPWQNSGITGT